MDNSADSSDIFITAEDIGIDIEKLCESSSEEDFEDNKGCSDKICVIKENELCEGKCYCKIAPTRQNPYRNKAQMQRGNPRTLKLALSIPTNYPESIHKAIKEFFREVEKNTNWFYLHEYEINAIREARDKALNDNSEGGVKDDELFREYLRHHLIIARIKNKHAEDNKKRKR